MALFFKKSQCAAMELLLFVEKSPGPRLTYCLQLLLDRLLGLPWRYTDQPGDFEAWQGPRLNYSSRRFTCPAVWIIPHGLLTSRGIAADCRPAPFTTDDGLPALFGNGQQASSFPFDLLSAAFYVSSRYEEYQPFEADAHGRFPASASLLFRAGWLEKPVVQLWAQALGANISQLFGLPPFPGPAYRFLPTYDIDIPWAYSLRGWRGAASLLAAFFTGKKSLLAQRLRVALGREKDPYDTFELLDQWHQTYCLQAVYFWLLAPRGHNDPGAPPGHPRLQALIRRLAARYATGIHPSWHSNFTPACLPREIGQLATITGAAVTASRQHFLWLRLPLTYRRLLDAGIRQDYSMGFADAPGFRAGLAVPFPWYDLENESLTELELIPLTVMDVSLRQYLKLSPAAALDKLRDLTDSLRNSGGWLVSLWHNSSFSDEHGWQGWAQIYQQFLYEQSTISQIPPEI